MRSFCLWLLAGSFTRLRPIPTPSLTGYKKGFGAVGSWKGALLRGRRPRHLRFRLCLLLLFLSDLLGLVKRHLGGDLSGVTARVEQSIDEQLFAS
jgi:hypothetical protein